MKDTLFEKHHPRARILEELFCNVPCLETSVCSSQAGFLFMFDIGTGTMLVRSRVSQEWELSWISKKRLHTSSHICTIQDCCLELCELC